MEKGILLEQALKDAITAVEGLQDGVCPVSEIHSSTGPLVVYDQSEESEHKTLAGDTGLLEAKFQLFVLHSTYMSMRLLAEKVKRAVKGLQGAQLPQLIIESVTVTLGTPDLLEGKVDLFRRSYNVSISYQYKEE